MDIDSSKSREGETSELLRSSQQSIAASAEAVSRIDMLIRSARQLMRHINELLSREPRNVQGT